MHCVRLHTLPSLFVRKVFTRPGPSLAGGMMFSKHISDDPASGSLMALTGDRPLSRFASLVASADAYVRASSLGASGIGGASPCDLGIRAVEARLAALLQLEHPSAVARDLSAVGRAKEEQVKAAAARVMGDIGRLDPRCRDQHEQALGALRARYDEWHARAVKAKTVPLLG